MLWLFLGTRCLAGVEGCSRESQVDLYPVYEWVRPAEYAPRDPFDVRERRHGLAEIVERRVVVTVERLCIIFPYLERK